MHSPAFWLKRLFQRNAMERDMSEEMQAHIAARAADLEREGMAPVDAVRAARVEFGAIENYKELARQQRRLHWLRGAGQDVRYALRGLRRSPGYALTAIITLTLGIGAVTAIFSAVYALLIRPLPYRDPSRLVWITEQRPKFGDMPMLPDAVAWNEQSHLLEAVAAYDDQQYTLTGAGEAARVSASDVSANFLSTLGVPVERGRDFSGRGNEHEVVITDRFWRQRFAADPRVPGSVINLDDKPYTVVGILPPDFRFPDMTLAPELLVQFPSGPDIANPRKGVSFVQVIGRAAAAKPEMAAVQAELQAVQAAQVRTYVPWMAELSAGTVVGVTSLQTHLVGDSRAPVLILFAAVGLVLLIACANIANLQLVRAVARRHEIAVRSALGASRGRLARQFLTESLAVSLSAAAGGVLLGALAVRALRGWRLSELPWLETVRLDPFVFVFTLAVAVTAALVFGVAPAISGSRTNAMDALKAAATRITGGRDSRWLRQAFVVIELALALVLLVGAGLLVRSFARLMRTDAGFDPQNVLSARVRLPMSKFHDYPAMADYAAQLLPRVQALPGVRYAALSTAMPLQGYSMSVLLAIGATPPPKIHASMSGPTTNVISVTPDFFRAMGTPISEGRPFNDQDNAQSIAVGIVNRALARKYLDGNALGKTVYSSMVGNCANCLHNGTFMPVQIVGVIPDVRHDGLEAPTVPELYLPFSQMPHGSIHVVLKTAGDPGALAAPLRSTVLAVNADVPAFQMATLEHRLSESLAQRRLTMFLLSAFALLAMILAAVGVYGVISYAVLQRTQEIGIRMALGATRSDVLRLVMGLQAGLIAGGGALGIVLAFAASRSLQSLLYGVGARDVATFIASWLLLTTLALLASAAPALRATRCEPTVALRYE